jgi:hypothetical protein
MIGRKKMSQHVSHLHIKFECPNAWNGNEIRMPKSMIPASNKRSTRYKNWFEHLSKFVESLLFVSHFKLRDLT